MRKWLKKLTTNVAWCTTELMPQYKKPDVTTMKRYVLFKCDLFCVYVHHIVAPEVTGMVHDHPRKLWTVILKGWYTEVRWYCGLNITDYEQTWEAGETHVIQTDYIHGIIRVAKGGCWTLCLGGPVTESWGFYKVENYSTSPWLRYIGK